MKKEKKEQVNHVGLNEEEKKIQLNHVDLNEKRKEGTIKSY